MWMWHRKMTAENHGLEIIKPATKVLTAADLPANWRDHIEVVTRKRSKVRINEVADDELDPFEALASSQKIIPLDDCHKAQIEALQRSITRPSGSPTTTCCKPTPGPQRVDRRRGQGTETGRRLRDQFPGRNPGNPNCFLFPLPNGAWRVYRFSPGVSEAETWSQDGKGWTTCYFNRRPDLAIAAKVHGGIEDPDKGGYVFKTPDDAIKAAKVLGQPDMTIDPMFEGRKTTLKPHKDGRLIVEIEREKGDAEQTEPKGWLAKKTKWVRVFETVDHHKQDDETEATRVRQRAPCPQDAPPAFLGWAKDKSGQWVGNPAANVKMLLQNLGNPKDKAECIMGGAVDQNWELVSLPFREEYPGGRQWNLDAAQFRYPPAALEPDETPVPSPLGHGLRPHRHRTDAGAARDCPGHKRPTSRRGPTTCGRGWPVPSAIPSSQRPICSSGATRTAARASSTKRWSCW